MRLTVKLLIFSLLLLSLLAAPAQAANPKHKGQDYRRQFLSYISNYKAATLPYKLNFQLYGDYQPEKYEKIARDDVKKFLYNRDLDSLERFNFYYVAKLISNEKFIGVVYLAEGGDGGSDLHMYLITYSPTGKYLSQLFIGAAIGDLGGFGVVKSEISKQLAIHVETRNSEGVPRSESENILGYSDYIYTMTEYSDAYYIINPRGYIRPRKQQTVKVTATKTGDVEYPQVTGLARRDVQEKVNNFLKKAACYGGCSEQPDENSNMDLEVEYTTSFTVGLLTNKVLSVKYDQIMDMKGAAHPQAGFSGYTINLQTGQVYKLRELFKPNSNFREKLDNIVRRTFLDSPDYQDIDIDCFLRNTYDSDSDCDDCYYFTENLLLVLNILPGSEHAVQVGIALSEVKELLNNPEYFSLTVSAAGDKTRPSIQH